VTKMYLTESGNKGVLCKFRQESFTNYSCIKF